MTWKFVQAFPEERRNRLLRKTDFSDVVQAVCESARVTRVWAKRGEAKGLTECVQPVFDIEVRPEVYDVFFNAAGGYRAQYLRSPTDGLAGNQAILGALLNRLVDEARRAQVEELRDIDVRLSLRALSSKVWIYEGTFDFDTPSQDLDIATWAEQAFQGEERATWGLCAPCGTLLQVKGALLDPFGHEVVPYRKILRHEHIHRFGFS